ncbi:MAG: hypothetical protein ACJAVR_001858 [Paracoccaceae bacterium]|jgi:hypothetical protein
MRFVDRSKFDRPAILTAPYTRGAAKGKSELDLVAEHIAQAKNGSYNFKRYKEDAVKQTLELMFHRKCAYCESAYNYVHPVDVEHYRPKSAVDEAPDHSGYWWLAMDWDNLLPSCIDCNRRRGQRVPGPLGESLADMAGSGWRRATTGKATLFPLGTEATRWADKDDADTEDRLLLDPCRDDPADHLAWHVDRDALLGLVHAKATPVPGADASVSKMGAVSIQVFGLNRTGLVQARTRVLRDMEFLYTLSVSLGTLAEQLRARSADEFDARVAAKLDALRASAFERMREKTAPDAPYSQIARAWARGVLDD